MSDYKYPIWFVRTSKWTSNRSFTTGKAAFKYAEKLKNVFKLKEVIVLKDGVKQ